MPIVVAHSIEAFDRAEWNGLFAGDVEDWSYYRAVEQSSLAGFTLLYFGVREDGKLVAAVPAFITDYRLDTTLSGSLRRITHAVAERFPGLLRQRLLSLGSPIGEVCHLGFAPGIGSDEQRRLLDILFSEVERYATRERIAMLATKDATAKQDELWASIGVAHRLRRQPSLPTAYLDIRFDSVDGYLATLSRATRRDLRRKIRAAADVRVEWRTEIDDIIGDIVRLYRATLARAEFAFEELTPDFFRLVLRELGPRAGCATYWIGERLVAFNLVLHDGTTLLDKFLGMDYTVARDYNLYYISWLENVRYCIEHGMTRLLAGQGLHREKLRLGSRLSPNWLWYRHRNRVLDVIFAAFERWFRLDRSDPELAALMPEPERRRAPIAAWCTFLTFAALSQIAFKLAAQQTGEFSLSAHWFGLALGTAWIWVSVASHIGEFVLWMTILSKSALSSAFGTSAILFVVVMLSGWLLFAEPLGWGKIIGSAAILCGILLIGTEDSAPHPNP